MAENPVQRHEPESAGRPAGAAGTDGPRSDPIEARTEREPRTARPSSPVVDYFVARRSDGIGRSRGRLLRALGFTALVVLVVLCVIAVGLVVRKTHDEGVQAAQAAARYSVPAQTGTSLAGSVVVIGDDSVSAAAPGVAADRSWPRLVQAALKTRVTALAGTGSAYLHGDVRSRTFGDLAEKTPADAQVVVFVGGSEDEGVASIPLERAATKAFSAARSRAPAAALVVVGPFVTSGHSAAQLATVRTALRGAARIAGAKFVDPVASNWLSSAPARGSALSASDERTLARRFQAVLDPLLG